MWFRWRLPRSLRSSRRDWYEFGVPRETVFVGQGKLFAASPISACTSGIRIVGPCQVLAGREAEHENSFTEWMADVNEKPPMEARPEPAMPKFRNPDARNPKQIRIQKDQMLQTSVSVISAFVIRACFGFRAVDFRASGLNFQCAAAADFRNRGFNAA